MATKNDVDRWQPPPLDMEHFREVDRWWRFTHFFLEWSDTEDWIYPCFEIQPLHNETVEKAYRNKDFYKLNIFDFDVENRDEKRFQLLIKMEHAFVHFFKEVFEIKSIERGYHYSFELSRIGLPKKKFEEISKTIEQHGLTEISELIFYIIAKAQDFYNDNVHFYESAEQKEIVRNIGKEADKAIDLIERVVKDREQPSDKYNNNDELLRVNFIFQNSETIQIKDPILRKQFVECFKDHYNNCYFKDWKLQLQLTTHYYEEERRRQQFRYRYAIALYNFLTKTALIKIDKELYPNNLMECILDIVEYSLVKVGKPDHSRAHKIKTIRNWIQDHELKPDVVVEKMQPDYSKLYKYFDKEFIDSIGDVKKADAIHDGLSLCLQFKTQNLQNEIVHIVACLKGWHMRVSQQLESGHIFPESPLPKEYNPFKKFVDSVADKKQFENITFKVEGDENIYELTDKLPIHLLQSAIRSHYKNFREDYETDILQAEIKNGLQEGSFSAKTTGHFNLPEDRFLPKIVSAFFNFLQDNAPALEKEFSPPDRYYALIAKALHVTYYFRDLYPEDWQLQGKVKYWHSLTSK